MLEKAEENKKSSKIVIFESQESHQDGPKCLKKTTYWTFKTLGLVAVQYNGIAAWTYSLKTHLQYSTWSVVLRPLLSFFWTNGPQMTLLFRSIDQNTPFLLLVKKRSHIPCLVWSCKCVHRMRADVLFFPASFRFFRHQFAVGVATSVIFCGDATT